MVNWAASVASAAWRSTASRAAFVSACLAVSWGQRSSIFLAAAFAASRAAVAVVSATSSAIRSANLLCRAASESRSLAKNVSR